MMINLSPTFVQQIYSPCFGSEKVFYCGDKFYIVYGKPLSEQVD